MQKNIIFFDRDGVINKDTRYTYKIKDFVFTDGIFELMQGLKDKFEFIIITNQSGINRGYYTRDDFNVLSNWMIKQFNEKGIQILDIFFCPHRPDDNCKCRKPKIGMIEQACDKYEISLQNSWFIGDNVSDMQCAINAGIKNKILISHNKPNNLECIIVKKINEILNTIQ